MNACDVCGDPLAAEVGIYDVDEFWELLAQGFEPDGRVIGLLVALAGMSTAQARAHWFQHVGARPVAEWRLCPACARQAERVRRGPLGRLAERRSACPVCGRANPAWRPECAACGAALHGAEPALPPSARGALAIAAGAN